MDQQKRKISSLNSDSKFIFQRHTESFLFFFVVVVNVTWTYSMPFGYFVSLHATSFKASFLQIPELHTFFPYIRTTNRSACLTFAFVQVLCRWVREQSLPTMKGTYGLSWNRPTWLEETVLVDHMPVWLYLPEATVMDLIAWPVQWNQSVGTIYGNLVKTTIRAFTKVEGVKGKMNMEEINVHQ